MKKQKYFVENSASKNEEVNVIVLPPNLLKKLGINLENISYQSSSRTENSSIGHASIDNLYQHINEDESSILETANLMRESVLLSPSFVPSSNGTPSDQPNELHTVETVSINDENHYVNIVTNAENSDTAVNNKFGNDCEDGYITPNHSKNDPETFAELKNNVEVQITRKPKIEIISEKILNPTDLNISKLGISKNSSCFSVPVNTIVAGKSSNRHCKNLAEKTVRKNNRKTTVINTFITRDDIGELTVNYLDNDVNNCFKDEDIFKDESITSTSIERNTQCFAEELLFNSTLESENNNYEQYINEMVLNHNDIKSKCLIDDDKTKIPQATTMNNEYQEIFSNTKNKEIKTELCFQGVEKPGGVPENEIKTVLRTYQRTTSNKVIPKTIHINELTNMEDSYQMPENHEKELHDFNIRTIRSCVCDDFGLIAEEDSDKIKTNICSLPVKYEEEYNEEAQEATTAQHIRRSPRKRKSTATEQVDETCEPTAKMTTNCGACDLVLPDSACNKHNDVEQNLIAWKEGKAIVENTAIEKSSSKNADKKYTSTGSTRRSSRLGGLDSSAEPSMPNDSLLKLGQSTDLETTEQQKCTRDKRNYNDKVKSEEANNTSLICPEAQKLSEHRELPEKSKKKPDLETSLKLIEKDVERSKPSRKSVKTDLRRSTRSSTNTSLNCEQIVDSMSSDITTKHNTESVKADSVNKSTRASKDTEVSSKIKSNSEVLQKLSKITKDPPIESDSSSSKSQKNEKNPNSKNCTRKLKEFDIFAQSLPPKTKATLDVEVTKRKRDRTLKTVNTDVEGSADPSQIVVIPLQYGKESAEGSKTSNAKGNSQETVAVGLQKASRSDNANAEASSSARNSATEDPPDSQPDETCYIISIKEEVVPVCDLCKKEVEEAKWIEHISKEHDYLAWRQGEAPLDIENEIVIHDHLYEIAKANGGLMCGKCGLVRKYVKSYLKHLRNCGDDNENQNQTMSTTADTTQDLDDVPLNTYSSQTPAVTNPLRTQPMIICGVCKAEVKENQWIEHIRTEHNYLAWKGHETPLDLEDDVEVKAHLTNISKYHGGLICHKCGILRLYVKKYLDHINKCTGEILNESIPNKTLNKSKVSTDLVEIEVLPNIVTCGKCGKEIEGLKWEEHIKEKHKYLAWIEGGEPIDEDDIEAVHKHLLKSVEMYGDLKCNKCGAARRSPRAYLEHVNACEQSGFDPKALFIPRSANVKADQYECAKCFEVGQLNKWRNHAMDKHYNVAWMTGEQPLNIRNHYAVEKLLKEYKKKHNLVCKECGSSRVSVFGFYAHVLVCGKSKKEVDSLMDLCDYCNKTYLCIYRNQHRTMHREQELKNKQKEIKAAKAAEERERDNAKVSGKRKAAEKANKVLEKYSSSIQADGTHVCSSCHISYENETQLKDHVCSSKDDASDSDASVKDEDEESDDEMEIDSNASDDDDEDPKRKRCAETLPKITLPYKVKDIAYYLGKSFEDFCTLHYTNDSLFDNWRCVFEIIPDEAASKYMPPLTESCKVRGSDDEWTTLKRFEARRAKEITLFTGASVRCMQWAPLRTDELQDDNYLAIACYCEADCPRFVIDDTPTHPGMLQIWNLGRLSSIPKLEVGLAHDYGTVWAMDWCPSGGRDLALEDNKQDPLRLGLIAIACSNGGAYILPIPRFTDNDSPIICKVKPAAELRFSARPDRRRYQATSISWSPQKGHNVVMVGYSDGTTAFYDLSIKSPWCKTTENGIDIFYPFEDKMTENSSIAGVVLSASPNPLHLYGSASSASVTGATMSSWGGAYPLVRSHAAASNLLHTPNWPAALLCSDDALTTKSANEMGWWGGGRRLGSVCGGGACARCGRLCLTAPPFVRVLRVHPGYPELKKQIVATVQMVPIAKKRKHKQDVLATVIEPLTYVDAIKQYGLEFKTVPKKYQRSASRLVDSVEQCPERFPLSDMPAAAFCPAPEHHNRVALASHAGFIFIINI